MPSKKSGRLMLRMDPDIHARVARTAKALGTDMNGLLNLIIREGLVRYEVEAHLLKRPGVLALLESWRQLNPSREVSSFFADYYSLMKGEIVTFENGKCYMLFSKRWTLTGSEAERGMVVAALMREPEGFTEVAPQAAPPDEGSEGKGNKDVPPGEHPEDISF